MWGTRSFGVLMRMRGTRRMVSSCRWGTRNKKIPTVASVLSLDASHPPT